MRLSRGSRYFLAFCVLVLAAGALGLAWLDGRIFGPDVEPGQPVTITVESGAAVSTVGDQLREQGVVRTTSGFRSQASSQELQAGLQPGEYDLETGMGARAAVAALLEGPDRSPALRWTVPEGLTVEQSLQRIADQLDPFEADDLRAVLDERLEVGENAEGLLTVPDWFPEPGAAGDEIIEPYEGLLFPNTYELPEDASARQVLQRMVDELDAVMTEVVGDGDADRYRLLTLASLVEREVRVGEERARVAGVISNRLDEGQRLQIDATVLYARGEHSNRVLFEDTDVDSPYNTYATEGLPPAPIAAPGRAAIEAAAAPEDHDLRFYVLSPECDGTHQFATDFEQHQAYVAELREVDGCRDTEATEQP